MPFRSTQRTTIQTVPFCKTSNGNGFFVLYCIYMYFFFFATVHSYPAHSRPLSRSSSVASSVMPGTPLYHCYRVTSYLLLKTKQIVLQLVLLCWRFLELHLHKIAMLILFVVSMSEVSAGYWVLLAVSLLAIPLPYFSPLLYPLLTLYLGLLVTLKTIYQFPIVSTNSFNLTDFNSSDKPDEQCYEPLVSLAAPQLCCCLLHVYRVWSACVHWCMTISVYTKTLCFV